MLGCGSDCGTLRLGAVACFAGALRLASRCSPPAALPAGAEALDAEAPVAGRLAVWALSLLRNARGMVLCGTPTYGHTHNHPTATIRYMLILLHHDYNAIDVLIMLNTLTDSAGVYTITVIRCICSGSASAGVSIDTMAFGRRTRRCGWRSRRVWTTQMLWGRLARLARRRARRAWDP